MAATEAWEGIVPRAVNEDAEVRWSSHPVRTDHRKNAVLVAVLVATTLLVHGLFGDPAWTVLSPLLLLVGVYDYWLPTHFALTSEGVERRTLFFRRFVPWHAVQSRWGDAHGVLVSRFAQRSRIEAHRGIYLRFAGNREAVLHTIDAHLGRRGQGA
jgi:hypothetical protein